MTDWIVTIARPAMELYCKRCHQKYKPNLPMPINLYVALSTEFVRFHSECEEPTVQAGDDIDTGDTDD